MFNHFDQAWNELLASDGFSLTDIEVRGVPMKQFAAAPPNMRSIWELATFHGDKPYIVFEDETYTYADIAAQVRALAHLLRDKHGIGSGDRVAVAMRNYPEWIISFWAITSLGAATVGVNAWWTPPELAFGLSDSKPKVVIADDERVERISQVADEIRATAPFHLISVRTDRELPSDSSRWEDVVDAASAPDTLPDADIDPDDDITIFYTSGTTGTPKGAQLTHRGSVQQLMGLGFLRMASSMAEAKAIEAGELPAPDPARASDPAAQAVVMAPTPLFHVTATNCLMQPATLTGARLVLMYKWDAGRALQLIEREKVTDFSGVPTMSREMILHPDWDKYDTSTVKGMGGGGAALQPDLVAKINSSLANGAPSTGYGLTETHGVVAATSSHLYTAKPASCGRVVPMLESRLVDEMGEVLEPNPDVVGQLSVRGPSIIKGYLNRPDATADAIRDGWFNTGDIARIDSDGFVFIVDRAKDMVIRGGENVYCNEVETAIYEHPDVAEAAVFGLPDDRLGEIVAAAIVTKPGTDMTHDQLRDFLADKLAKFKIPEQVSFRVEQLPRNANGKFLKRQLRDELVD